MAFLSEAFGQRHCEFSLLDPEAKNIGTHTSTLGTGMDPVRTVFSVLRCHAVPDSGLLFTIIMCCRLDGSLPLVHGCCCHDTKSCDSHRQTLPLLIYLRNYRRGRAGPPAAAPAHGAHDDYTQAPPSTSQHRHHVAGSSVRHVASRYSTRMLRSLSQVLNFDSRTQNMARYAPNGVNSTVFPGDRLGPHTPTRIAFFVSSPAVTRG